MNVESLRQSLRDSEAGAATFPQVVQTLIAALRAAQHDEIRYPEFLRRAANAGTAAYRVFITGRRVVYLGRKGEVHIEHFPPAKP